MRKRKIAKRIVATLSAMIMLVFCAIPALAADVPETEGSNQTRAIVTHRVNMQKIIVRPTYSDNGVIKSLPGYIYNRSGNFAQIVACTVTAEQKAELNQRVIDAGQTQVGYEITVYYTISGTFRGGGVVTRTPANTPNIRVASGLQEATKFYTLIDSPNFKWDAYFMDETGNTSSVEAVVKFE